MLTIICLSVTQILGFLPDLNISTFQSGFCEQVCCARAQASTPGLARSALDDDNGDNGVFLTRSLLLVAMRKMMMIL